MRIVVCMKQVPDPEGPQDCFQIDPDALRVEPRGIPPVLSVFDENALEAALRIKDARQGEVHITVLTAARRVSSAVLQKALAVGADDLVKVEGIPLDPGGLDSFATASVLASAIRKVGSVDLILAGRQAADWNAGQVGIGIARILGCPAVTMARKVDAEEGHVVVERVIPGGYEVVRAPLPALIVASNEVGSMRYPTMIQRREARKKPVESWDLETLGLSDLPPNRVVLKKLFSPVLRQARCAMMEGSSPGDAGRMLAQRLRSDGLL